MCLVITWTVVYKIYYISIYIFYILFIPRQIQKSKNFENQRSTSKDTYKTTFIILFKLFSHLNLKWLEKPDWFNHVPMSFMWEHERIHHDVTTHHATSNCITNCECEPKHECEPKTRTLKQTWLPRDIHKPTKHHNMARHVTWDIFSRPSMKLLKNNFPHVTIC